MCGCWTHQEDWAPEGDRGCVESSCWLQAAWPQARCAYGCCLWHPCPTIRGTPRSFLCKEQTGANLLGYPWDWVQQGLSGVIHQHSTIQEEWGQSLPCAIFYPEMLLSWVVLMCWGMPLEDATLNSADGAVTRKQKRLNVLLRPTQSVILNGLWASWYWTKCENGFL